MDRDNTAHREFVEGKKECNSGGPGARRQKRSKDKLMDDLIPNEKVIGARQFLFGATDTTQNQEQLKKGNMSEEKKDKRQVNMRDLTTKKDPKGGPGGTINGVHGGKPQKLI